MRPGDHGPCRFSHSISSAALVRILKDPVRVAIEVLDVARLRVGEAANRDAAHAVGAFGVLVLPA